MAGGPSVRCLFALGTMGSSIVAAVLLLGCSGTSSHDPHVLIGVWNSRVRSELNQLREGVSYRPAVVSWIVLSSLAKPDVFESPLWYDRVRLSTGRSIVDRLLHVLPPELMVMAGAEMLLAIHTYVHAASEKKYTACRIKARSSKTPSGSMHASRMAMAKTGLYIILHP